MMKISAPMNDSGSTSGAAIISALLLSMLCISLATYNSALNQYTQKNEERMCELIYESNTQTLADYPVIEGEIE